MLLHASVNLHQKRRILSAKNLLALRSNDLRAAESTARENERRALELHASLAMQRATEADRVRSTINSEIRRISRNAPAGAFAPDDGAGAAPEYDSLGLAPPPRRKAAARQPGLIGMAARITERITDRFTDRRTDRRTERSGSAGSGDSNRSSPRRGVESPGGPGPGPGAGVDEVIVRVSRRQSAVI